MRISRQVIVTLLLILWVVSMLLLACSSNDDGTQSQEQEDVVITIGNLSDLTGVAANAMELIDMALEDLVEHFNEENLIPGVELEVITYDGQYDPARDIPGYEWLRERGADLIWTPAPPAAATLKPRADEDKFMLFASAANLDELMPAGYTFSAGTIPEFQAYTLLDWLAKNDWDYTTNGPAKIGAAGWADNYLTSLFDAAEEYADVHPDQFEWVSGHLTDFGFTWGPEVDALKDCDYIIIPNPMTNFVKGYRELRYTAKFLGTDNHGAFLGMIDDAGLWDEIDEMLMIRSTKWWNEEGAIIDLTKKLLYEYHPDEAEEIMAKGVGYIAMANLYQVLTIIQNAAEIVGPDNVDSEALYEAAQSFSLMVDGVERFNFNETKRYSTNYYGIYLADETSEDLIRVGTEWYQQLLEP